MNQIDLLSGEPAPLTLIYHGDPGHGWIEADIEHLKRLGIANDISAYSYISRDGRTAYLEEDCDATRFVNKLRELGTPHTFKHHHSERDSFIRRLPGYPAQPRLIG